MSVHESDDALTVPILIHRQMPLISLYTDTQIHRHT